MDVLLSATNKLSRLSQENLSVNGNKPSTHGVRLANSTKNTPEPEPDDFYIPHPPQLFPDLLPDLTSNSHEAKPPTIQKESSTQPTTGLTAAIESNKSINVIPLSLRKEEKKPTDNKTIKQKRKHEPSKHQDKVDTQPSKRNRYQRSGNSLEDIFKDLAKELGLKQKTKCLNKENSLKLEIIKACITYCKEGTIEIEPTSFSDKKITTRKYYQLSGSLLKELQQALNIPDSDDPGFELILSICLNKLRQHRNESKLLQQQGLASTPSPLPLPPVSQQATGAVENPLPITDISRTISLPALEDSISEQLLVPFEPDTSNLEREMNILNNLSETDFINELTAYQEQPTTASTPYISSSQPSETTIYAKLFQENITLKQKLAQSEKQRAKLTADNFNLSQSTEQLKKHINVHQKQFALAKKNIFQSAKKLQQHWMNDQKELKKTIQKHEETINSLRLENASIKKHNKKIRTMGKSTGSSNSPEILSQNPKLPPLPQHFPAVQCTGDKSLNSQAKKCEPGVLQQPFPQSEKSTEQSQLTELMESAKKLYDELVEKHPSETDLSNMKKITDLYSSIIIFYDKHKQFSIATSHAFNDENLNLLIANNNAEIMRLEKFLKESYDLYQENLKTDSLYSNTTDKRHLNKKNNICIRLYNELIKRRDALIERTQLYSDVQARRAEQNHQPTSKT